MSTQHSFFAQVTASAPSHPMGAWVLAAILCVCFLGILGGAMLVTTWLDRHRQAGAERNRQGATPATQRHS